MFSTFSSTSYPVGVRNLIKERQKYLFRSLYTKEKRPSSDGRFFFPLAAKLRPSVADMRAESAFAKGEVSRLCIPPLAVSCHARRCYYPFARAVNTQNCYKVAFWFSFWVLFKHNKQKPHIFAKDFCNGAILTFCCRYVKVYMYLKLGCIVVLKIS